MVILEKKQNKTKNRPSKVIRKGRPTCMSVVSSPEVGPNLSPAARILVLMSAMTAESVNAVLDEASSNPCHVELPPSLFSLFSFTIFYVLRESKA